MEQRQQGRTLVTTMTTMEGPQAPVLHFPPTLPGCRRWATTQVNGCGTFVAKDHLEFGKPQISMVTARIRDRILDRVEHDVPEGIIFSMCVGASGIDWVNLKPHAEKAIMPLAYLHQLLIEGEGLDLTGMANRAFVRDQNDSLCVLESRMGIYGTPAWTLDLIDPGTRFECAPGVVILLSASAQSPLVAEA